MRAFFSSAARRCATTLGSWRNNRSMKSCFSGVPASAANRKQDSSSFLREKLLKSCSSVMQTLSTSRFVATSQ